MGNLFTYTRYPSTILSNEQIKELTRDICYNHCLNTLDKVDRVKILMAAFNNKEDKDKLSAHLKHDHPAIYEAYSQAI
jgi:hypothetical protein